VWRPVEHAIQFVEIHINLNAAVELSFEQRSGRYCSR
jgi:hypothetical protein